MLPVITASTGQLEPVVDSSASSRTKSKSPETNEKMQNPFSTQKQKIKQEPIRPASPIHIVESTPREICEFMDTFGKA